jgi:anti-sigma B factor antagonist
MEAYQISVVGEKGYVRVAGDLADEAAIDRLWVSVLSLLERGERVIILDLSDVQTINSYGVGKLLACYKRVKDEGSSLMVRSLCDGVKEVFELLMIDRLILVDSN